MKFKHLLVAAVTTAAIAGPAVAEWPEKPIQLIVPWGAGGATDQVTRVVAAEMEAQLGQSVVVVNQPAPPDRSAAKPRGMLPMMAIHGRRARQRIWAPMPSPAKWTHRSRIGISTSIPR